MIDRPLLLTMLMGIAALALPHDGHRAIFLWNASASVPMGLYAIEPIDIVGVPDLVVVAPPEPLAAYLAERGYLPLGVPLLKRVFAMGGDIVCRDGSAIVAFDTRYEVVREVDSSGRPLPMWRGCRTLADDEIFFMNWDAADSFDSRYVGPLPRSTIIGRAVPLWTDTGHRSDEATDGPT